MTLNEKELSEVLKRVSPTGTDYQAGRICRLLAKGEATTGKIAATCSVGNLADVIAKAINPKIAELGLYIVCSKPPMPIRNQFGQRGGDWIYEFKRFKADKAANDDNYNAQVDDWEQTLEEIFSRDLDKDINNMLGGG